MSVIERGVAGADVCHLKLQVVPSRHPGSWLPNPQLAISAFIGRNNLSDGLEPHFGGIIRGEGGRKDYAIRASEALKPC
jgi:hypothetical protein